MRISFLNSLSDALSSYHQIRYFVEENVFTCDECDELIKAGMELSNVKKQDFRPRIMI